jgi:hypothetical protein
MKTGAGRTTDSTSVFILEILLKKERIQERSEENLSDDQLLFRAMVRSLQRNGSASEAEVKYEELKQKVTNKHKGEQQ